MKAREFFRKTLVLLVLVMIPISVNALANETEYKVYDDNNNYEFSCTLGDVGDVDDHIDYELQVCIADNKKIEPDRVTINRVNDIVYYDIEYGTGILKWNGDVDTNWYDENSSVYYIKNAKELAGLAYLVNTGNTFTDKTVKLASDIDLSGYNWVPIGKNYTYPFKGDFDGQGYSINNLSFEIYDDFNYYGLFGYVTDGIVKNINVSLDVNFDYETDKDLYIAGVSGYSSSATFDSIVTTGKINIDIDNAIVASIVGTGYLDIKNCQSYVNITSSAFNVAGIVGSAQSISATNCVNFGNLHSTNSSSDARVAGITSWVYGGSFAYSINYGTITADNNILKGSILGFSGYGGESFNHVYTQDNINILSGELGNASEQITADNINEILNILNQSGNWQIVDNKIVNVLDDVNVYNINIISNHGNVYYSGKDNTIVIKVLADKGYKVDTINVYDSNNQKIEVNNNEFVMPNSDVTINVSFKPFTYQFTSGENEIYQGDDLVFTLDGEYDLIDKVLINNQELDSKNYVISDSSVTLKNEYLKTLAAGIYEITVIYTNGMSDTTTFTIEKENGVQEDDQSDLENNQSDLENNQSVLEDKADNPKTSDGILFYIIFGLISLIGLVSTGIYLKKYN